MKIHFKINYNTVWGQRLLITGNLPILGNGDYRKAMNLIYSHPGNWLGTVELQADQLTDFHYQYIIFDENANSCVPEWGEMRKISTEFSNATNILCVDEWNEASAIENTLSSAPFKEVLLKDEHPNETITVPSKFTHYYRVKAPLLPKNYVLCMIGNCKQLGNWAVKKPLLMKKSGDFWHAYVDLSKCQAEVQYKYGLYDPEVDCFCGFENGPDRPTEILNDKNALVQHHDGFAHISVPTWKGAGVGLPVFSIRTKQSFGVGDFGDMKLFIDWSARVGMKLIQVLPLNDTIGTHTEADVLPYAAITAFALNPLFLNLPAMGNLPVTHSLQKEYKRKQLELNASKLVDFLQVVNFKMAYARELYLIQKEKFLKNKSFQQFLKESEYWIGSYAVFCVLRDKYKTSDYRQWEENATFSQSLVDAMTATDSSDFDEVAVHYFIQYHLHVQLSEAHTYAHQRGVVLKGDIPIGVNRNSVDTWAHPELFHLDKQAGAPPDMFSVKGQNWELPTYNWSAIKRTEFEWWKMRFAQMSNYFDTFRVDHILGFFRIWQIPMDQVEGVMGSLYPSEPVKINEFGDKGIYFDYNRFCRPYVTDTILWDFFGEESGWVKTNCLQVEDGWVLRLKPEYCSQKFVEELFNNGTISERVKWGLFDLISNVLFFEEQGSNGTRFYPRFGMQSVRSFADLDDFSRQKLDELYVDYYFKRQDAHWYKSGMEKLPALKRSTNMLICGEDLGLMTRCVTDVMKELSILSLEVQRAPKTSTIEFFHPADAPYLSVVTPSTHDMSTVRGWWEEDRGVTQRFYNQQLGHGGDAPWFAEWWICRDILLQHLYSPAMWAIFQMQDLLSISDKIRSENPHDERINVPSNSLFSWRYRLHVNMEDLLLNDEFNDELRNYIIQSGRG